MTENKKNFTDTVSDSYQLKHIDVLDGLRATAIMIIVWFHIWQQSWLMPVYKSINLDWIPRNGSLCVDMMILLSGFCLFLPYAREMVLGEKAAPAKEFYIKRAARIMPSYYAAIFICLFLFALPSGQYSSKTFMIKDVVSHLFFVHNFRADTLLGTKLNGALWTVAVEMQLYLLFPFIAKLFQKKPVLTYTAMVAASQAGCLLICRNAPALEMRLYVNHTLTFFSVFANGMLGALAYITVARDIKKSKPVQLLFFILACAGVMFYRLMCSSYSSSADKLIWQVENRFLLSLVFLLIVFSVVMARDLFRPLLANRIMKFIAGISFNLYIWHQYIAVLLKEARIPFWQGDVPPNMLNDKVWMWKYQTICFASAFAAAAAMTYLVEKPAARMILKKFSKKI